MSFSSRFGGQGDAARLRDIKAALAGRYDIQHRIGGGGAADVYLAYALGGERKVAVKVYSGLCAEGIGTERFVREVRLTAQLNHPNILPVIESGVDAGQLFYIMPFAESGTLADLLYRRVRLSVGRTRRIVGDLASALSYAHGRGIVHRDIKPENVMLFGRHALLADFGIAKLMKGAPLSAAGIPLGTPDFMAPEQVLSRPVDRRTDIYALGVMIYEMLAGERLFVRDNAMQTMAAHVSAEPPDLSAKRNDLPVELIEAVRKSLQKDPDSRWQTMEDLTLAIAAVEAGPYRSSSDSWFVSTLESHPSPV